MRTNNNKAQQLACCRLVLAVAVGLSVAVLVSWNLQQLEINSHHRLLLNNNNGELVRLAFSSLGGTTLDHHHASQSSLPSSWDTSPKLREWKPMDCNVFLQHVFSKDAKDSSSKATAGIVQDPNKGELYARFTETRHPFWIALHEAAVDNVRWGTLKSGYYYEKQLTRIFEEILEQAPANARVIDVGGNIGWFSFLSASMKHHVDVFEPVGMNLIRQCQSKRLNQLEELTDEDEINHRTTKRSTVHIRPLAVSNQVTTTSMVMKPNNPGATKVTSTSNGSNTLPQEDSELVTVSHVPLTTLDKMAEDLGWFDDDDDIEQKNRPAVVIAILKIDIEGAEPQAVAGAKRLLESGLVRHILLEVTKGNTRAKNQAVEQMVSTIFEAGYDLHQWGGYLGPFKPLPAAYPPKDDVSKRVKYIASTLYPARHNQANLWFRQRGRRGQQTATPQR